MLPLKAPLFKDDRATFERVEKFLSTHHFTDCNLRGRLYGTTVDLLNGSAIKHVDFGMQRPLFADAKKSLQTDGKIVGADFSFGPTWTTHWFEVTIQLPVPVEIDEQEKTAVSNVCISNASSVAVLRWKSDCEAMVWSKEGSPLLGLNSTFDRTDMRLTDYAPGTDAVFYIECACNEMFGAGKCGQISPPDSARVFRLSMACLSFLRPDVYDLLMDFEVLFEFSKHASKDTDRRYQALYTANHMINHLVMNEVGGRFSAESIQEARQIASTFLTQKNSNNQHTVHAVGNCHIDTAWLWTYAETRRKCARSWATTLDLMNEYPQLNFAVSQAQQLVWLKEDYPTLFDRIVERGKEGRFIGVGGCWVEMDGNLPSGESMCRQMLYGQQVFKETFGKYCTEFWLPDTFGYSTQLPQVMRAAGMHRFVTQKLGWNFVNAFPHHTFRWQGLDGSDVITHFPPADTYCSEVMRAAGIHRFVTQKLGWNFVNAFPYHTFRWRGLDGSDVITHFPPADTYCSDVTVEKCLKIANHRDKGRVHSSLLLYGHGDGGGGPQREMLERLKRLEDLDGCPKLKPSTPGNLFSELEDASVEQNLCTWSGELYLELHNATYTTQAKTKWRNRLFEEKLRICDIIGAWLWLNSRGEERHDFSDAWKMLLLNQFHDVLPGSSIAQVYEDATLLYDKVGNCIDEFFAKLMLDCNQASDSVKSKVALLNPFGWHDRVLLSDDRVCSLAPFSVTRPSSQLADVTDQYRPVTLSRLAGGAFTIANAYLSAEIDARGRVTRLQAASGEALSANLAGSNCNRFVMFHDVPLYWDAWDCMDYHLETKMRLEEVSEALCVKLHTDSVVQLSYGLTISPTSRLTQTITLCRHLPYLEFKTEVVWNENHRFLKVEFPVNVRNDHATYETQFGHLKRPNHRNTSWDAAKYEVCGHRWADLSECDLGVALLNDCKYGHSCHGDTLTLSLLRASKAPDPNADIGTHNFAYALMPYTGTFQKPRNHPPINVIQASRKFNFYSPLNDHVYDRRVDDSWHRTLPNCDTSVPIVELSGEVNAESIVLDTMKVSEDGRALVLRLYESFGGRTSVLVSLAGSPPISAVHLSDVLERPLAPLDVDQRRNGFTVAFEPFKIVTVLISFDF